MINAVRLGDFVKSLCKKKPSGPFIKCCKISFINNRAQAVVGSKSVPGVAITGSKTKIVCNRPAVRIKDKVICGKILTGSKDTFIG